MLAKKAYGRIAIKNNKYPLLKNTDLIFRNHKYIYIVKASTP